MATPLVQNKQTEYSQTAQRNAPCPLLLYRSNQLPSAYRSSSKEQQNKTETSRFVQQTQRNALCPKQASRIFKSSPTAKRSLSKTSKQNIKNTPIEKRPLSKTSKQNINNTPIAKHPLFKTCKQNINSTPISRFSEAGLLE